MMAKYPTTPWATLNLSSYFVAAIGRSVWDPARVVAVVLALLGCAGVAAVAALALRSGQASTVAHFLCALVGGVLTFGFHVWSVFQGPESNPIGSVFVLLVGWALLAVGMFAISRERAQEPVA